MTATVPTNAELTAYKTLVASQQAAQDTRLGLIEARLVALETLPPVIPPVVPPIPAGTHEPVGFVEWTNRSFDTVVSGGWGAQAENAGPILIVQDSTAPISPPNVGQITYPAGFTGGGYAPAQAWKSGLLALGFRQLYVRFGVKLSANWQSHPSGVNKIGFVWMHGQPVAYWSAQDSSLIPEIRIQGTGEGARNLVPLSGTLQGGGWHVWETLFQTNTPGQPDGICRWWLDGILVGDYRDVMWAGAGQVNLWGENQDSVSWFPIWGGISGTTLGQEQQMSMDHFYVSGL